MMDPAKNDKTSAPEAQKPCRHCQTPVPAAADVCPVCKLSQVAWWSWIQIVSPSAALIVASVSMFTWFVSLLPNLSRQLWPTTKLVLFRCNSTDGAVVFNAGNVPIFISRITLLSKGRSFVAPEIPIYEVVEPGKFVKAAASSKNDFEVFGDSYWARRLTNEQLTARIEDATAGRRCTRIALFAESDPTLLKLRAEVTNSVPLQQIEAAGFLEYRATSSPEGQQFLTFPVVGLILASTKPGCPIEPPPSASTSPSHP